MFCGGFFFAVVEPGQPAWHQIKEHFGAECFQEDGTLNRVKLGDIIFHDDSKRKLLNSITHPQIHKRMAKKYYSTFFEVFLIDSSRVFHLLQTISPRYGEILCFSYLSFSRQQNFKFHSLTTNFCEFVVWCY